MRIVEVQRQRFQLCVNIGGYGIGVGAEVVVTAYTVWADVRIGPLYIHLWCGWRS